MIVVVQSTIRTAAVPTATKAVVSSARNSIIRLSPSAETMVFLTGRGDLPATIDFASTILS